MMEEAPFSVGKESRKGLPCAMHSCFLLFKAREMAGFVYRNLQACPHLAKSRISVSDPLKPMFTAAPGIYIKKCS